MLRNEVRRRRIEAPDQKEKKDCLKLCLYNLPKCATMEMITHAIKEKMGAKNIVDLYYHASELHTSAKGDITPHHAKK
jgi:hypothetical protein